MAKGSESIAVTAGGGSTWTDLFRTTVFGGTDDSIGASLVTVEVLSGSIELQVNTIHNVAVANPSSNDTQPMNAGRSYDFVGKGAKTGTINHVRARSTAGATVAFAVRGA